MNSAATRMISGYELRNISVRDSLPEVNGHLTNSADWGPVVSATNPLGEYSEDYDFTAKGATLDKFNGRFCKTPEYPNGTYAYFCTEDMAGTPIYPYMIGPWYYGEPESDNIGPRSNITMSTSNCSTQSTVSINESNELMFGNIKLYPNPTNGVLNFELTDNNELVKIDLLDMTGKQIHSKTASNANFTIDLRDHSKGVYFLKVTKSDKVYTQKVIIQ